MKKVGLVLASTLVLAGSIAVPTALGSRAKAARSVGPAVSLQIKTRTKTLFSSRSVRGQSGWITKGGTPSGKCSASSAAGALNAATHGKWVGKYYSGVGIFIASILGVKPTGTSYWAIYVNGKSSNVGVCGIKLHAGQRLLFQIHK